MKFINEKPKSIPVLAETDVLVVGGGPAGLGAAIAAAREGVDTIMLERFSAFGGNITHAGVEAVAWYRHEGTVEAGGILQEMEERSKAIGASSNEPQSTSQALNAEMFKYVADKMVLEAGVRPLLHCLAVDAIVEDGVIKGVIVESKSGRQAILAKTIIDCTGDGDIAAFAGAPYEKAEKNDLMSITPVFNVRGVDTKTFKDFIQNTLKPTYRDWGGEAWQQDVDPKVIDMFSPYIETPFNEARDEGKLSSEGGISWGGTWSTIDDNTGDVTQMNMIFMNGYDCTDVEDLTKAEIQGREAVLKALEILREKVPGFRDSKLRDYATTIGTRESRKIEGHYYLTEKDVLGEARFEDSIGIFPEFVDGRQYLYIPTTGRYFQVPYRCMMPKKVDNLLVAGRAISGDKAAHCGFRNMSCCVVTGQGAGVACATAVKSGATTSTVDIKSVQENLKKQGVRID